MQDEPEKPMARNTVLLFVESRYKVDRKRIISTITNLLQEQEISLPCEVSIAVVGDRKMQKLNKKYRGKDSTTNVLSFLLAEGDSAALPADNILRLGDVVISYPQMISDAARDNMLVDDKIDQLIKHGMLHLLGIHHE